MNVLQKRILSVLKENKRTMPIPTIARKLRTNNTAAIIAEVDLLHNNGFVEIERATGGRIKRVSINEKGEEFFYEGNKLLNKKEIQLQIDELKEAVEILNQALNAKTPEEKQGFLDKMDKVQSILNGGIQLVGSISKFL